MSEVKDQPTNEQVTECDLKGAAFESHEHVP